MSIAKYNPLERKKERKKERKNNSVHFVGASLWKQAGCVKEHIRCCCKRQIWKRAWAVFLALLMVIVSLPETGIVVHAADEITYLSCDSDGRNWTTSTCSSATEVTSENTEWGTSDNETWYVARGTVTISSRVTVNGTVHLILEDNCNLTISGGIGVSGGNEFTIYAQSDENEMGHLTVEKVDTDHAGIGGGRLEHESGKIVINGGNILSTASGGSAGIGGGQGYYGDVTINGGKVTASSEDGAGIGNGYCGGKAGGVVINGGVVTASGNYGAGIGGGFKGDGIVTIKGGVITATSTKRSGIGSGLSSPNSTVTITNSPVIFASSISDQSGKENNTWGGVIFEGDSGEVYGTSVTVDTDFTIPSGKTLVVPEDTNLTVNDGRTVTNNGTIKVDGTMDAASADRVAQNVPQYKLAVTNGTVRGVTAESTDEENNIYSYYISYKTDVSVNADAAPDGKGLVGWNVSGINNTTQRTSPLAFTMPAAVVTVAAKYVDKADTPNLADKVTAYAEKLEIQALTGTDTYGEAQYSIDGTNWQTSNVFTGLTENTEYTVYAKYMGNNSYAESDAGSTTVTTKQWASDTNVTEPTGLKATYGQKLDDIKFEEESGWSWKEPNTKVTMNQSGYEAMFAPTDTDGFDYSKVDGYCLIDDKVYIVRTLSVDVSKATPKITWSETTQTAGYTGKAINPDKLTPPTVTLVNNESYSGTINYTYRKSGTTDDFADGLPTDIGTYEVKASIDADGNYTAAETESTMTLTIHWLTTDAVATLKDQSNASLTGDAWAQSVTFTAPSDYTISNTVDGTYGTSFTYNTETEAAGATVTYYIKNNDGEIAEKTATVRIDRTAPNWTGDNCGISIKENWWNSVLSTISFGLFYKETVEIKVCANDSFSGVAAYYYYIDTTGTIKTAEELDKLSFTAYTEGVSGQNPNVTVKSISGEGNYIVYAYAVDAVGNRSAYVCSDGVVVDNTAPAISDIVAPSKAASTLTDTSAQISFTGSEAGTYFYMVKEGSDGAPSSITGFATENTGDGNSTWTANEGVSYASMTAGADNKIMLSDLKANTAYTLYVAAVDLAGNSTGTTVLSRTFTTCKTMPKVTTDPKISGTYGDAVSAMTLTNGKAVVNNVEITGTWKVTDTNVLDVPDVGTTNSYEVTFEPKDSQYETVTVQVTPTIAKKAVTVTADDKEKAYGEANPEFTFTVPDDVLVPGDAETDLAITLSCEAGVNSPVKEGGYAITGTSKSANYDVTVTPGTLTIKKANAEITVGTASYNKKFGDADFVLNVTDTNTEASVQYEVTESKNAAGDVVDNDAVVTVDNSGNITITGVGTATITVTLPASTNYNAADSKTITVTVVKADAPSIADVEKYYLYSAGSNGKTVTVDIAALLPTDRGTTTYDLAVNDAAYVIDKAVSEDGKLTYQVAAQDSAGATTTLTVTATTENYENITVKVNITLTDKKVTVEKEGAKVAVSGSNELTYGQKLSDLTLNTNTAKFVVDGTDEEVTGTLAWTNPDAVLDAGTTTAQWIFTPEDIENYTTLTGNLTIKVVQKVIKVNALDQVIYTGENVHTTLTEDNTIPVISYEGFDGTEEQTAVINTDDMPAVSAEGYNASSPAGNYVITVSTCGSVKADAAKNYKLEKGNTATLTVIEKKTDTELTKVFDDATSGTLDSVAVAEPGAPKADLDSIFVENAKGLLTEAEAAAVKGNDSTAGKDALLYLKLSNVDTTATQPEKDAIESKMKSAVAQDAKVGKYLDVSLFLKIAQTSNRQITDTSDTKLGENKGFKVKVTIDIPSDIPSVKTGYNRMYKIIRAHYNNTGKLETEVLETTQNGNQLTFETDKFSVYAITYKDTEKPSVPVETEKPLVIITPEPTTPAETEKPHNTGGGSSSGNGSSSGGSGSSSGGGGGISSVPVTGITVTPENATLTKAGESIRLTAEVSPSYATNKNVTWTSDNEAVATVDSTGKVTAVGNGTATITATTQSGNKTATVVITVNIVPVVSDKPPVPTDTDQPSVPAETEKPPVIIPTAPVTTENPTGTVTPIVPTASVVTATPEVTAAPTVPTPIVEPTVPAETDTPKDTTTPKETATPEPTATPNKVTSEFGTLKARSKKQTSTTVTLKWSKVSKADGYLIYGSKCNTKDKKYTNQLRKTIKGNKTLSWTQKKLKKATGYKYQIKAYKLVNGRKVVIAQSVGVYAITKGGKYCITEAVEITKLAGKKVSEKSLKLTLKKGKNAQITAAETPAEKKKSIKRYRGLCYESSNSKVATVTKSGKIKAVKKGTCKIYVYAQNGVYKTITITVK